MLKDNWKKYELEMKAKRRKLNPCELTKNPKEFSDLMVQQMSPEASGKMKKYHPLSPREFVPFAFSEPTLENIKKACEEHFQKPKGSCDVLASDRGPSCSKSSQLSGKKFIWLDFWLVMEKAIMLLLVI